MILQLQQKYFTIGGDKFNITDQNGNPVYQAKEIFFRVRGNAHLYAQQVFAVFVSHNVVLTKPRPQFCFHIADFSALQVV